MSMPTDEPGGWELRRALTELRSDMQSGLQGINGRLDKLVGVDAHAADMKRLEAAISTLTRDLATEIAQRRADDESLRSDLKSRFAGMPSLVLMVIAIVSVVLNLYGYATTH